MKQVHKFLNLSPVEQRLLIKSVLLLGAITIGLRVCSFQKLRHWLAGIGQKPDKLPHINRSSPKRVAWAVKVARRYTPAATCLPQALAVQTLLRQAGYPSCLHIGVAKNEDGQLEAHAWVEIQGEIIIGNIQNLGHYTPLPSWEGERV